MKELVQARVIRGEAREELPPKPLVSAASVHRVVAEEVKAREAAAEIVSHARAEGDRIVAEARRAAERVAEDAAREAREAESAKLAAHYLRLRDEDERRSARDLDRSASLAVVVAERILGHALEVEPGLIADIARQALAEARGARSVVITAHPADAGALGSRLVSAGLAGVSVDIRPDSSVPRGSLHLHTNLGVLDVELRPQVERLVKALKDV
jgi:flagellar biosynthesis/type III secretory pathway protein FliH